MFPWVLADYQSARLDLGGEHAGPGGTARAPPPGTFRDLARPMGAQQPAGGGGSSRLEQFGARYDALAQAYREAGGRASGEAPPFHYGTHYSCAGCVLCSTLHTSSRRACTQLVS